MSGGAYNYICYKMSSESLDSVDMKSSDSEDLLSLVEKAEELFPDSRGAKLLREYHDKLLEAKSLGEKLAKLACRVEWHASGDREVTPQEWEELTEKLR